MYIIRKKISRNIRVEASAILERNLNVDLKISWSDILKKSIGDRKEDEFRSGTAGKSGRMLEVTKPDRH